MKQIEISKYNNDKQFSNNIKLNNNPSNPFDNNKSFSKNPFIPFEPVSYQANYDNHENLIQTDIFNIDETNITMRSKSKSNKEETDYTTKKTSNINEFNDIITKDTTIIDPSQTNRKTGNRK